MGNRRKSREAALQILYKIDLSKMEAREAMRIFWQQHPAGDDVEDFANQIVDGVIRNRPEIDKLIEDHATHWKLSRMACVDRNILRMAVYELMYCHDIPNSVTLNEAIEVAKKFGTEESGAFINGVLDHISKELKP